MEADAVIKKFSLMASVSALALVQGADLAAAQELDVTKRPRPEYDAAGLRAGSFLIFPKTTISETYNTNIYATENNTADDFITRLSPEITVNSDWNNHALNARAFVDHAFYASHNDEDYTDYGLLADGRIDIQRSAYLFAGGGAEHLHEDRGSENAVNGTDPTEFDRYTANLGGTYKPNRLGVTLEGNWKNLDFDDVSTSTGATINNDDRDRDVYGERLRIGYDVQPGYTAFIQGSLNQRDYDSVPDDNGFNRNSDGYRVDAGIEVRLSNVIDAEFFGGYFNQNYDDARFSDVSAFDAGARVLWSVNPLTTVKASLARSVEETVQINSSSYVATIAEVGVDYELRRNILIGAGGSFSNNDYQGISRNDDVWRLNLNGKYLINRRFFVGATVGYADRDSNTANKSYEQFTAGAFVGAQF